MHPLLSRLLQKREIEKVEELLPQEKETFDRWNTILSEGEMTLEKVANFCATQLKLIESQWKDMSNTKEKNERLIIMHIVYSAIKEVLYAPQSEKEHLEKYLLTLLR